CARGGYGCVRIVDLVDFSSLLSQPKWIMGYSDVTVFLQHINTLGVAGIHGAMPIDFEQQSPVVKRYFRQLLLEKRLGFEFSMQEVLRKKASVTGRLFGGNLSVLYSLLCSKSCYNPKNGILFLEDIDEHLYHIDRMFWALRRAGIFDGLEALLIGGMTDLKDNTKAFGFSNDNPFGLSLVEIVQQATAGFDFPVIFGFPVGHHSEHFPVIAGAEVSLSIENNRAQLNYTNDGKA
ncbi:MAG: LD-carboxypeptidase, partial [Flavobacteriaceae bacterium]|nr:LD-carboxypeptidase [Flavobacteriaceae bacterium]